MNARSLASIAIVAVAPLVMRAQTPMQKVAAFRQLLI